LCPYCNEPFRVESEEKKQKHIEDCVAHMFKEKRLKLAESAKTRIKFSRFDSLQEYPFFAVADFESRMLPASVDHTGNTRVDHEAVSGVLMLVVPKRADVGPYGPYCVSKYRLGKHCAEVHKNYPHVTLETVETSDMDGFMFTYVRTDEERPDASAHFLEFSLDLAQGIDGNFFPKYDGPVTKPWTETCETGVASSSLDEDEVEEEKASAEQEECEPTNEACTETEANAVWPCYLCHKRLRVKNLILEHCHLTGAFRGWSCKGCNRRVAINRGELPILFHNFSGYDANLVMVGAACVNQGCKAKGAHLRSRRVPT
jgi:hypothetical protein